MYLFDAALVAAVAAHCKTSIPVSENGLRAVSHLVASNAENKRLLLEAGIAAGEELILYDVSDRSCRLALALPIPNRDSFSVMYGRIAAVVVATAADAVDAVVVAAAVAAAMCSSYSYSSFSSSFLSPPPPPIALRSRTLTDLHFLLPMKHWSVR